jgi:hypothetical protein
MAGTAPPAPRQDELSLPVQALMNSSDIVGQANLEETARVAMRTFLTRGATTSTAPAGVSTSRGWWVPLRTTSRRQRLRISPTRVVVQHVLSPLGQQPQIVCDGHAGVGQQRPCLLNRQREITHRLGHPVRLALGEVRGQLAQKCARLGPGELPHPQLPIHA